MIKFRKDYNLWIKRKQMRKLIRQYVDDKHMDYGTKRKNDIEAKDRYGGLLDNEKPSYKLHEDMLKVDNWNRNLRQQRADEYEQENRRRRNALRANRQITIKK